MIDGVYSDKSAKDELRLAKEAAAAEALSEKDLGKRIKLLEKQMLEHARNLEFEKAARMRDQLAALREQAFGAPGADNVAAIAEAPGRRSRVGKPCRRRANCPALEAEPIPPISTKSVGFRYTRLNRSG